jgi:DNA-binding response OmpR family regulator
VQEALSVLHQAQTAGRLFALVLLDTTLPAEDSGQLAEQITASPALAGALIVMVSPALQGVSLARWREMKDAIYVMKPLAPSELWEAIMTVLAPPAVMTLSTP